MPLSVKMRSAKRQDAIQSMKQLKKYISLWNKNMYGKNKPHLRHVASKIKYWGKEVCDDTIAYDVYRMNLKAQTQGKIKWKKQKKKR